MTDSKLITLTNCPKYPGRKFQRESANLIAKRSSAADNHMAEGKSYKHAWYLAFQEFPRTYSDEDFLAKGNLRTNEVDTEAPSTSEDSG